MNRAGVMGVTGVSVALAMVACSGVAGRMRDAAAPMRPCPEMLSLNDSISRDPSYATQPRDERERYEVRVAECEIDMTKPADASALARGWSDGVRFEKYKTLARAEAELGHDAEARSALELLTESPALNLGFLLDTSQLRRYAQEDRFVALTLHVWRRAQSLSLEQLAATLARNAGGSLLSLRVAAADETRAQGDWVAWTGVVRDARIDREKDETLLFVEGVDVKEEMLAIDRRVESIESQRRFMPLGPPTYDSKPTYRTERIYKEVFVPNGRNFVVRYPLARDSLVEMRTVIAFGRYAGRGGADAQPMVQAVIVTSREAKENHRPE